MLITYSKTTLLFTLIIALTSCTKSISNSSSSNGEESPQDSVNVVSEILDQYGTTVKFEYDPSTKKISKIYSYYNDINWASTYIFYNKFNNLSYSVHRGADGFNNVVLGIMLFRHDLQGRLDKIYYQTKDWLPTNDTNNIYVTSPIDGSVSSNYDSISYDAKNRMVAINRIRNSIGYYFIDASYALEYNLQNDSLLSKVRYSHDNTSDSLEFTSFTATINPYNSLFPFYWCVTFPKMTFIPMFPWGCHDYLERFMVLNKYLVSQAKYVTSEGYSTKYFFYNYDDNELPVDCHNGNFSFDCCSLDFVKWKYTKMK